MIYDPHKMNLKHDHDAFKCLECLKNPKGWVPPIRTKAQIIEDKNRERKFHKKWRNQPKKCTIKRKTVTYTKYKKWIKKKLSKKTKTIKEKKNTKESKKNRMKRGRTESKIKNKTNIIKYIEGKRKKRNYDVYKQNFMLQGLTKVVLQNPSKRKSKKKKNTILSNEESKIEIDANEQDQQWFSEDNENTGYYETGDNFQYKREDLQNEAEGSSESEESEQFDEDDDESRSV